MPRSIHTNADITALQQYHDLAFLIELVSLGALRTAPAVYQELHMLLRARVGWVCHNIAILEGFFWMARAIQDLRDTLQQFAANQNAVLQGPNSALHIFVSMRQLSFHLHDSRRNFKFKPGVLLERVERLSKYIDGLGEEVLRNRLTVAQVQAHVPEVLIMIDELLDAPMRF